MAACPAYLCARLPCPAPLTALRPASPEHPCPNTRAPSPPPSLAPQRAHICRDCSARRLHPRLGNGLPPADHPGRRLPQLHRPRQRHHHPRVWRRQRGPAEGLFWPPPGQRRDPHDPPLGGAALRRPLRAGATAHRGGGGPGDRGHDLCPACELQPWPKLAWPACITAAHVHGDRPNDPSPPTTHPPRRASPTWWSTRGTPCFGTATARSARSTKSLAGPATGPRAWSRRGCLEAEGGNGLVAPPPCARSSHPAPLLRPFPPCVSGPSLSICLHGLTPPCHGQGAPLALQLHATPQPRGPARPARRGPRLTVLPADPLAPRTWRSRLSPLCLFCEHCVRAIATGPWGTPSSDWEASPDEPLSCAGGGCGGCIIRSIPGDRGSSQSGSKQNLARCPVSKSRHS